MNIALHKIKLHIWANTAQKET